MILPRGPEGPRRVGRVCCAQSDSNPTTEEPKLKRYTERQNATRPKKVRYLFQLLHVQRLVQVQTSVLIFAGGRVDEPLQEPLRIKREVRHEDD